jgi:hypothetical protein
MINQQKQIDRQAKQINTFKAKNKKMRRLLVVLCCFIVVADQQQANARSNIKNEAPGLHFSAVKSFSGFKSYGNYLRYLNIKSFKGVDSANAYYRNQYELRALIYTDYLPLAGGTLSGPLVGTSAMFSDGLAVTGSNYFEAGILGLAEPIASYGLTHLYPQFTINTFNATTAAAYLGWNIQSATNASDASKYILSNYATKITGDDGSFHFFTAPTGIAGNTVGFTDVFSIANNGNAVVGGGITAGAAAFSSGSFSAGISANGANTFQAGVSGLAVPVASFGLTNSYPQFTINTFNQTSAAAYLGWNIQSASNASDASKYIISNYATKITGDNGSFHFFTAGEGTAGNTVVFSDVFAIANNGNISAKGHITTKKLIVTQLGWSDYVFEENYNLRPLSSLECFIKQNKHLPGVPSAKEVAEDGLSVGDNQALLLKKIEELTLYLIQQQKEINSLKANQKHSK